MEIVEEVLFLQRERQETLAEYTEAMALVQMAAAMLSDPEDRLGLRDQWYDKAKEVWGRYLTRMGHGHAGDSAEARDTNQIGDETGAENQVSEMQ